MIHMVRYFTTMEFKKQEKMGKKTKKHVGNDNKKFISYTLLRKPTILKSFKMNTDKTK